MDRFDQRVALEARDVGDGPANRIERDLALRKQQRELFHFLLRGEEVSLDAIGKPLEGFHGGTLFLPCQPLREEVGELVSRYRLRLDDGAGRVDGGEPVR